MRYKPYLQTLLFAAASILLVFCMIRFPQNAFEASLRGLKIWWDIVFPALLPFLIFSEIMVSFGVAHFIGALLEPLMRPIFNVPGAGGFVMTMGLSSGYPVGPKLAAEMRKQKILSRAEGERLVCFTSTADPLFIFGAVAVGFFHDASIGLTILIANYAGALLIGVALRFHDRKAKATPQLASDGQSIVARAFLAMHRARLKERRPFGQLMGEAILNSFQTLFAIGGFIIIFSVMIEFLSLGALSTALAAGAAFVLSIFQLPESMAHALVVGFFEVTQSIRFLSELDAPIELNVQIALASALIAWGGVSVHAQIASIISSTDLRFKPYFIWRGIHAFVAGFLAYFLWTPTQAISEPTRSVLAFAQNVPTGGFSFAWSVFQQLSAFFAILLLGLCLASCVVHLFKKRFIESK